MHRGTYLTVSSVALFLSAVGAAEATSWRDLARERGVDFHHAGDDGLGKFISVLGSGACFADFDGDGYEDLYLPNIKFWDRERDEREQPSAGLYRNNGDGTFTDVRAASGTAMRAWAQGCAAADYDGDGDVDLFVAAYAVNALFRNEGGFRFTNVTDSAGASSVGECPGYPCWGTSAAFGDLDGDGCLDLYVVNYVEYTTDEDRGNGPGPYTGQKNLFYHNKCNGTFAQEADAWNLDDDPALDHSKSLGVAMADHDRDGDLDIYVTSDTVPNTLFRNNGDRTFTDVAVLAGVDDPRASMGLAFDDVDGDGLPDLYFTHYHKENNGFYVNLGDESFEDRSGWGALDDDLDYVGWGAGFLDADNDGDKDIYVVNGHTSDDGVSYNQSRLLFLNDGGLRFRNATLEGGVGFTMESVARGSAYADIEYDGDLDLVVANNADQDANLLIATGAQGGFLEVTLRQGGMNRFAIGAEVKVTPAGGLPATRVVQAGTSYASQNGLVQHFGLGDAQTANVDVRWPDGTRESWSNVPANSLIRLTRGSATASLDALPPKTALVLSEEGRDGWFNAPVTVELPADDRGVPRASGVRETRYRLGDGPWLEYRGPFIVGAGLHVLEYHSIDAEGNVEPVRSASVSVDLEDPVTALVIQDAAGEWLGPGSSVVLVSHDGESGLRGTYHRLAGGEIQRYGPPLTFTGERKLRIDYFAEDIAGNTERIRSRTVQVDTVPPTSLLDLSGPVLEREGKTFVTSETHVQILATDAGSGVARVEYRVNGGEWTPFNEAFHLSGDDGDHTVEHRAVDRAGNAGEPASVILTLDNHTPPPLTLLYPMRWNAGGYDVDVNLSTAQPAWPHAGPALGWEDPEIAFGSVRVEADAGRDVSGIAWIRALVDGEERVRGPGLHLGWFWETSVERAGWHTLTVETSDGNGNVAREERHLFVVPIAAKGLLATAADGVAPPPGR